MKAYILKLVLIGLIPTVSLNMSAQVLDLIVTSKGDSIACRIDSISDTHIYYEMKFRGNWIHTLLSLAEVSDYRSDAVDKRNMDFIPGTSIIDTSYNLTLQQIRTNSIYLGIGTLMYSKMIPAGKVGIIFGGGICNFDGWGLIAESSLLLGGGVKHFIEPGIMGAYSFDRSSSEEGEEPNMGVVSIRIGYRYQGPRGLLIRAAPNLIFADEFYLLPALSLGFSF